MRSGHAWRGFVLATVVAMLVLLSPAPATAASLLRQGSRGPAVVQLQARLTALRYDVGGVDGIFGPSTAHAVVAFQKVNGLARDGIVGPRTRAALSRPVRPQLHDPRRGSSVEVDLARQVLLLGRDGRVHRIVDVSTGKPTTPTPRGRYRIERRIDGWRTSRLGTMWRPAYFSGGYALHGYSSVPSHAASHGCVRMTNAAMNRLWPAVPIRTPVIVYR